MRKIRWIVLLIVLGVGGFFGYRYFSQTYLSHTAYALVPTKVPEKTRAVDANGEYIKGIYAYDYEFEFVDENGKIQKMAYELSGENPQPLIPNVYVKAEISKTRVTEGPNDVYKKDIPTKVLKVLNQKHE